MYNKATLISKQNRLLSGKQLFDVELSTRCNKICSVCPRDKLCRKKSDMSYETFTTLINWLPSLCHVMFAGFGEPLLNKNVFDYVELFKEKKRDSTLSIYTNGILLDEVTIKKLFYYGLDLIQFSIVDEESIPPAKKALNVCNENGLQNRIRFNVLYKNENEYEKIQNRIKESLTQNLTNTNFKKMHNRGGLLYDFNFQEEIKTCGTFFMDTFIDSDGNIQICSNDVNGQNTIGNIQQLDYHSLIQKKRVFLGNVEISSLCKKCSDEYRLLHFNEV